jgi:hypothetical protein
MRAGFPTTGSRRFDAFAHGSSSKARRESNTKIEAIRTAYTDHFLQQSVAGRPTAEATVG